MDWKLTRIWGILFATVSLICTIRAIVFSVCGSPCSSLHFAGVMAFCRQNSHARFPLRALGSCVSLSLEKFKGARKPANPLPTILQPFANLVPTFRQAFANPLPTFSANPSPSSSSVGPRHPFRNADYWLFGWSIFLDKSARLLI